MWWFFVRDFYRAGEGNSAAATSMRETSSRHCERSEAIQLTAEEAGLPRSKAPRNDEGFPDLIHYLQRLSAEGEHAFGLWDSQAGFSVFSANFERVTGLEAADCAGHGWIASIHPQQQYSLNEALLTAEEEGRTGQCLVQARAGEAAEWSWLRVDVAPATAHAPVMVLLRNVTEQHALDEALRQTQAALAVSERGRAAFLSSMSHELRTPLNAIMGFSEMMKSGVFGSMPNATYQQYAEDIHASGQLLLGKVNDLLDIAHMDAGGLQLEEENCHLRSLLGEIVEIYSHDAFARGQSLKLDCSAAIEIEADRAKLLCILSHFVSNALRHSPDEAEIALTARVDPHDGLIVSVRDHGEGIPPAQLQTIRDALNAEVAYFNIEPGGIGLGLSLSRELAGRHNGRVIVDSIRHRGTVISLQLPPERILAGLPVKKRRSS